MLQLPVMSSRDETPNPPADTPLVLPKHLRFVRSLALVSGAVVGIAAGAAVFGSGCGQSCAGICGFYEVAPPIDAQYDRPVDHPGARDAGESDGPEKLDAKRGPTSGHGGGGPSPSPHLPADWLA
jgi:hypothetical protein